MSNLSPATVVGCLLDVSDSMREALEAGRFDERATDRLRAVLRAALKLAQSEQRHDPDALIFISIFGLDTNNKCPPAIDLCAAADALLGNPGDRRSGHDLLIARANRENMPYITKYIREKLTDDEARIVDVHLERHADQVKEFVDTIPRQETVVAARAACILGGTAAGAIAGASMGPAGIAVGAVAGGYSANEAAKKEEDNAVEQSKALHLARRICAAWLQDFTTSVPRPVGDVIRLLERLQERSVAEEADEGGGMGDTTLLDTLSRYMYGRTPMRHALKRSLRVFKKHPDAKNRILVLVSDGLSTDGNPLPLADKLKQAKVTIATVYLTSDRTAAYRRLYYQPAEGWDPGRHILFSMAARVAGVRHPITMLASMGWEIPSAGEVALHATVSSSAALDEFCSQLLSARLGSVENILLRVMRPISYSG